MIDDVVVGSVGKMTFSNWHINVDVSMRPDVVVPANAVARVGQTSLLGSMHVALDPPLGQAPSGRLEPGATIAVDRTSTYPSTEQTLSSLSAVVTGGGLGQIGDIIHNLNAALSGREGDVRDLLTRLDNFVGTSTASATTSSPRSTALNRLAGTFADQRDVHLAGADHDPARAGRADQGAAPDHHRAGQAARLQRHRNGIGRTTPRPTWCTNLKNLDPTLRALADVGRTSTPRWRTSRSSRSARTSSTEGSEATTSTSSAVSI